MDAHRHDLEKQVQDSMLLLEDELSEAYGAAVEIVPELVQKETKIADFLRAENYNSNNAALRIARYWKMRRALFGDRWLLSMTQVYAMACNSNCPCRSIPHILRRCMTHRPLPAP